MYCTHGGAMAVHRPKGAKTFIANFNGSRVGVAAEFSHESHFTPAAIALSPGPGVQPFIALCRGARVSARAAGCYRGDDRRRNNNII